MTFVERFRPIAAIDDRRSAAEIGNPVVNLRAKWVRDHVICTILISLGGKGRTERKKGRKKKEEQNTSDHHATRSPRIHDYYRCLRNASL